MINRTAHYRNSIFSKDQISESQKRIGPDRFMEFLILLLLGIVTGTVAGLLGVGGGIVIVPMLVWFLSHSDHFAFFYRRSDK